MSSILFLFLLACASVTWGAIPPGCNNTRAAVLECIEQLLDSDHNGQITPVEVAVALQTSFTFVPEWLTWQLVMRCDLNEDGVLTMEDWNANPMNMTCLPTQNCINIACSVCVQNGFSQSKRSPGPQPQSVPIGVPPGNIHRVPLKRTPEQVRLLEREMEAELQRQAQAQHPATDKDKTQ